MGALDTLNATNASGQATDIATGAVQSGDLATDSVGSGAIIDAAIVNAKYADNSISPAKIGPSGSTLDSTTFYRGDNTWAVPPNTTYSAFTGATSSAAGGSGLVPAPAAGEEAEFLRGDGTWSAAGGSGVPTDVGANGIGIMKLCHMAGPTGQTVASGGTRAGSALQEYTVGTTNNLAQSPALPGTWRNVTGVTLQVGHGQRDGGTCQRIS